MSDRCRSCRAPILWAVTEKGRRIPLDPEPRADGNLVLHVQAMGSPLAVFAGSGHVGIRYVSHFATCAHAAQHRRR